MRSTLNRLVSAATFFMLGITVFIYSQPTVVQGAPPNASAGTLISVADNVESNGALLSLPPIDVSKYSEITVLAYGPDIPLNYAVEGAGLVGLVFTSSPVPFSADLTIPAANAGICRFTTLGTAQCNLRLDGTAGSDHPVHVQPSFTVM